MSARPLAGRVAIVTGANHGIGAAAAIELARLGADIAVGYRRIASVPDPGRPDAYDEQRQFDATDVVAAIEALGTQAHAIDADLSDPPFVQDDGRRSWSTGAMSTAETTTDTDPAPPFDLATTPIHLGLGATAVPLEDFSWSAERMAAYGEMAAPDGIEGRLVTLGELAESWDSWERHPAGQEVVVVLSGRADLIQEIDGEERRVELTAGQAVINPPGVWHTADVHEPGQALFITPGAGTEHRPR